jgi:hypothetical protein
MRIRAAASIVFIVSVAGAVPADAQYRLRGSNDRATGENYNVEIGGYFWTPGTDIFITSESLPGILGTRIDFVEDLGIENKRHTQIKVVLRPATKHKFRFEYTPIKYTVTGGVLRRDVVFNGIEFPIAIPVDTELIWRAYRFGYEWDFLYMDRGFVGVVLEAKYTDIQATLTNILDTEFVRARAPIPAIGVIGRGYVAPNISITGEFGFFKWPDGLIEEDSGGSYYDFDLYGTVNFNDKAGAQIGYRSFDVFYRVDNDEGSLKLKGLYFGGVVRF